MKIKTITIDLFDNSTPKQLELSLDKTKNVNCIIGENASGKTRIFNMIKSFYLDSNNDSKIQLEQIDNEKKVDVDLLFVGEENIFEAKKLLERFHQNLTSDNISLIEKNTNKFTSSIVGVPESNQDFRISVEKMYVNQNLATSQKLVLNYALLTSIRRILAPNHILIIDEGFGKVKPDFVYKTIELLSKNSPQLLLFLTDTTFLGITQNTSESLFDKLKKNGRLGNVYKLEREEIKKVE